MKLLIRCFLVLGLILSLGTSGARADLFTITSDLSNATEPQNTTFSADVSLATGVTSQTLTIKLTNTTATDPPAGYITGFVFGLPTGASYVAGSYTTTDADFTLVKNESASPFDTYPLGAALGGNWTGGGDPNDGIAWNGNSATFTFGFSGTSLTLEDFRTAFTYENKKTPTGFIVRFRGLSNKESNKVPGGPPGPIIVTPAVPEPSSLAIAGLGALGLIGYGLRRHSK